LVTLGGSSQPFQVSAADLLLKEQELLGSRYVTRSEVLEACDLVARGEIFPLVTELRPLEEAEAVHARVERGEVIGRAALRIADA
jgi:D-arabinose 1-dehydrogenase-like Zn-dependent alcohol dehydrogenase